jgi:hypothetical protein
MDSETLATLEKASAPYRRVGFVITSQSEGAITLVYPPEKFSYLLFIILLLIWPLALIYLISHYNQRGKNVCLRITSQGYVEESGYMLSTLARDRKRRIFISILLFTVIAVITLFIVICGYFIGTV